MSSSPVLTYEFSAPSRIVFGWGRRGEAGKLARSLGRRAFVVCGSRTLATNGALEDIVKSLRDAGVDTVRTEMVPREPLVEDVDRCVAFLQKQNAGAGDLLLAIGGGSAIDLAKAAGALVTQDSTDSILDYLEGVGQGLKIVNTPLPVMAMPTTGGTGSEATKNAVISSYDPPFKKSLRSEQMVPRIVLVDPELAVSVPPHVTAWTGMDAITQLIESYISRRATHATRELAMRGLHLALPTRSMWRIGPTPDKLAHVPVVQAFHSGNARSAREAMAHAALVSGLALANSGLGMAHGVAAALGVHCNAPHGLACAVMLPAALKFNLSAPEPPLVDNRELAALLVFAGSAGNQESRYQDRVAVDALSQGLFVQTALDVVESLQGELRIPRRLSEIGVKREQIPAIVCDSRGNSMSGNPRELSDEELTRILEEML